VPSRRPATQSSRYSTSDFEKYPYLKMSFVHDETTRRLMSSALQLVVVTR